MNSLHGNKFDTSIIMVGIKVFGLDLWQEYNYQKQQKKDKRQVNEFRWEYRDCIKIKIGITRHIMMHVLYIVQLLNKHGNMHII